MNCPKCNSSKTKRTGCVHTPDNEKYRQYECFDCKHLFYSVEFEVEPNEKFRKEWAKYSRHGKNK